MASAQIQIAPQAPVQIAQPNIAAFAIQIAAKSDQGARHFDIRLDPPELGSVDVKLSIDHSGQAQAHLTVEKPQTLNMMQRDSSDLARALRESGVNLSQNGLNFSLKGQEKNGGNATPFRGRGRALAVTAATDAVSAVSAAPATRFTADSSRLDIHV
jgi:flagellar hook-length control protein FliK